MTENQSKKESVVVRLDSESPEVNATAVATSMTALISLIGEAQQGIAENQRILVKARPFAEGSFEIPLELIAISAASLFAQSPLIDNVLETIKRYFDVKAAIRDTPIPVDQNEVVNVRGRDITIGSIVVNMIQPISQANREVERALQEIRQDPTIRGIEVLRGDDRELLSRIDRQEIPKEPRLLQLATELSNERTIFVTENLYIVAPIFQGKAKWKFNRDGTIISADIADEEFSSRVLAGTETFRAGDRLQVELSIYQTLDGPTNSYLSKKYTIEKVLDHKKRADQRSLLD